MWECIYHAKKGDVVLYQGTFADCMMVLNENTNRLKASCSIIRHSINPVCRDVSKVYSQNWKGK